MKPWLEFWDSVSVLQVVGWILALFGLIGFVVKGWPKFRAFVSFIDALLSLPAFIARTDATLHAQDVKIEGIHHETHANSGSSLKDQARRIEKGVAGLYDVVAKVVKDNPELSEELSNTRDPIHKKEA